MKNLLELNIGLLRNTDKQENRVIGIYNNLNRDFGGHDYRIANGIGDWGKEKTYIARVPLQSSNIKLINTILEYMCIDFNQDAIAYMLDEVGYIAFNPNYTGEKFEFNINYFERFAE